MHLSWKRRRAESEQGRPFSARKRPDERQRNSGRRPRSCRRRKWLLLWLPTSSSKFLSRRDGRPSNGPVGRILRPGIGTRCGRRGSASANDLPDRHKAGPRHMGRSQLNGWLCRGWKGLPTSSLARGSLTPDTPGRAFSLTGLGTNGLGSRSSDPGNDVCVHACSSAGPVDSAMSVCARCRFPALIELDGACKKSYCYWEIQSKDEVAISGNISRNLRTTGPPPGGSRKRARK